MIKQCDYFQKIALGRVLDFLIFDQLLGKEGEGGGVKKCQYQNFTLANLFIFKSSRMQCALVFFHFWSP